ncbi:hypothetical protein C6496_12440 [Candidatus Poribacteria bacterium]|nr:MAG: hypothetical protein C6496_12440 [Candidatus Poribacteria bacterium]
MLPFVLKIADQPVERLQRINVENQPIDVDVQLEFYSREFEPADMASSSRRQRLSQLILQEATENAYATFVTFLRDSAEPQNFLPFEHLERYPCRRYALILSASRSHELFEICQIQPDASHSTLNYRGYEIAIKPRRYVLDTAAYLVAPDKYTLFIRQVREDNTIRVYRSDFINLTRNSPAPFKLDTRDIMENVQLELARETEQALPLEQLLMFPPANEEAGLPHIVNCPECNGRVRRLGREGYFCLECDWDNLPPLKRLS